MKPIHSKFCSLLFFALCLSSLAFLRAAERTPVPDLTQGGKPDQCHDWPLGPTGARGWIWGWKCQTTDARQILITSVEKGSPADGILLNGDVILGVDGKPFESDARIRFAQAITEAETVVKHGFLNLIRWREGKASNVVLKLEVLGSYAPTAPYNCPKSKLIFERGCKAIAKKGLKNERGEIQISIENDMNALALLASGREEYRPLLANYAHAVATSQPGGYESWNYGYDTLFLAEYTLANRLRLDPVVMDGLKRLALDIARGASAVGSWGHNFARPDKGLDGYGCMNQPGIILALAMTLAREAGVRSPELDRTIATASFFLRWYVHKGCVPYGDHLPWHWHDDNGKCSSAAVLFDILGDREAAAYYSRMGTAAYDERESGHTGNYFNITWALPGVSRCGPAATATYLQKNTWYYDLARSWDGHCSYLGLAGEGRESYSSWDCTGSFLLGYALPLKSLYLTGKKPTVVTPLTAAEIADTMKAGRDFSFWTEKTCYDGRSTEDLMAGLSSWSPAVRRRSAQSLGAREGDFVPDLMKMLDSPNRDSRYGACEALAQLGINSDPSAPQRKTKKNQPSAGQPLEEAKSDPAAPKMRALLKDPDPWVRFLAAGALAKMGSAARAAAVPDLLRAMTLRDPADPRERSQEGMVTALFSPSPGLPGNSVLEKSLDGVDSSLLYPAIKDVLANQDSRIRSYVTPIYSLLRPEDLKALLPDIIKTVQTPAPSGEMYGYQTRFSGLSLLAKLRIREGMQICVDMMNENDGVYSWRGVKPAKPEFRWGLDLSKCAAALNEYGGAAKDFLPKIREVRERRAQQMQRGNSSKIAKEVADLDKAIAAIETDKNPAPVISLASYIGQKATK